MNARGYRCVFLAILMYWVFLLQSPCWQLFGCGLCSVFPVVVPPTVLALSLGGEGKGKVLVPESQDSWNPSPYLTILCVLRWIASLVAEDLLSSATGSCQVTHTAQIPDPSCVGCAGVCAHIPKSALELPDISSHMVGFSLLRSAPLVPRGWLVAPASSLSEGDVRCNEVGADRLSLALWLQQLPDCDASWLPVDFFGLRVTLSHLPSGLYPQKGWYCYQVFIDAVFCLLVFHWWLKAEICFMERKQIMPHIEPNITSSWSTKVSL